MSMAQGQGIAVPQPFATSRQRARLAGLVVIALAQALAMAAGAVGTRMAFAGLERLGAVPATALGLIAGAGLVIALSRPALRLVGERMSLDYVADLRHALLDHSMQSAPEAIAGRRRGYLVLRISGDMTALREGLARGIPAIVQAAAMVPAAVLVLTLIAPRFGLVAGGLALASVAVLLLSLQPLARADDALRRDRGRVAAALAERMPIAPELALMGRRRAEMQLIDRLSGMLRKSALSRIGRGEMLRALPEALSGLAAAAFLWDGARRGLTAADLAAALAALGLLMLPLRDLMQAADRLVACRTAYVKLRRALGRPVADLGGGTRRVARRPLAIDLRDEAGALGPIREFRLGPGQTGTLPVGDPRRAALIIAGRQRDDACEVAIGQQPIGLLSRGSLRRSVAVIRKDPPVLRGSLRRNLTLGSLRRPGDGELRQRLSEAGLCDALERLGGLDARIAEGGRLMSDADRIAISVMRAALQGAGLLIVLPGQDEFPPDLLQYLERTQATCLWLRLAPPALAA